MSVSRLLDETVVLVVGHEERIFSMHKGLLCSVSDYFKEVLKSEFKEASLQSFVLPEESAWIFERFQLWLYSEQVLDKEEDTSSLDFDQLVELYAFAERRCMPKLQNSLVDLIIKKTVFEKHMPVPGDGNMYTVLGPSSPLLKLAVDLAAHEGSFNEDWYLEDYPKQFLADVIRVLRHFRDDAPEERDFWKVRCDYHVHAKGELRCSGKAKK